MDQNNPDSVLDGGSEPESAGAPSAGAPSAGAGAFAQSDDVAAGSAGADYQPDELDALVREAESLVTGGSAAAESTMAVGGAPGGQPDEAGAALAAALAEEQATGAGGRQTGGAGAALPTHEVNLPAFDVSEVAKEANQPLSLLYDVEMNVKIELGRTHMYVEDVLKLCEGSVVELDRLAGDPVDVYVNGRLVARGEVLVLNDNFCVRVSEIVSQPEARMVG